MARRQQERSAQTRRSLLDGAVHCLNADGYMGLTGVRVCEHIGISRGAMLHQFPTRTVFLAAIVDHILERRLTETDTLIQHALEAHNRVLRWRVISQHYQTPIFVALNELLTACRTDEALNSIMAPKYAHHRKNVIHRHNAHQPYGATNVPIAIQIHLISYFFAGRLTESGMPDALPLDTVLAFLDTIDQKLSQP